MTPSVIEANKNPLGEQLVAHFLIERAVRAQFHTVWLTVDPATWAMRKVPPAERRPVIYVCTHPSWWDGYLTWPLNRVLGGRDGYLMMDAASLQHLRFFTWIGVFGIDRTDPRAALASIAYSADLLQGAPNRAVWMFPQGTITPPDRRPLGLYPGVAHIAAKLPACDVVPVAWRMVYRWEQHAEVFIRVGAPLAVPDGARLARRTLTAQIDTALTSADDRLRTELTDAALDGPLPGYRPLLRGRPSINRVWTAVQRRAMQFVGRDPGPPAP
ncbi:MAG TPA: lysophospholipid acyltransferase family protein [Chloroflexia bacterium]|nr:lysophospholipid acyltransferase family protein [Chloroflexia bacterium]